MKAQMTIDTQSGVASVAVEFSTREEAGLAIDAVKNAAIVLWPDIVFEEEDRLAVAPKRAKETRPRDYAKAPAPGSKKDLVLQFVRKAKRVNRDEIADRFDLSNGIAAMLLAQLRNGGHLEGLK